MLKLHKIAVLILISFSLVSSLSAQVKKMQNNPNYDDKPFHLGFTLGFNSLSYKLIPSKDFLLQDSIYKMEVKKFPGFNLGMVTNLRISEHWDLRMLPGMIFGERIIVFSEKVGGGKLNPVLENYEMHMPSIYLDVPLLIKYKATRINNYRPYVVGGASFKYDLETIRENKDNEGYTLKINPLDYFYEIGIGIDFYMSFFKFSTELKLSNGLSNINNPENIAHSRAIDQLKSKCIMLSLHFE
ncbi:MAG: PorT family protein [Bacteroidales bacterium]|nr:PorT family protein [Bacteroidales bacterium]